MPVERSAGAVIFCESSKGREYLLLHHPDMESKSRPFSRASDLVQGYDMDSADLHQGHTTLKGRDKRATKAVAGHWSFPKGHVEKGETTQETVRREVREETGISQLEFVPDFKETIQYFVKYNGEKRMKFVAFFLCRTKKEEVIISFEHQGFAWLPYKQAHKTITYASDKKVLKAAEAFLSK